MVNTISIGLGEQVVSRNPEDVLVAYGLGSCLGISMYDPATRLGGLVHIVLPESVNGNGKDPSKYANTGVICLLDQMVKTGADRKRLIIRMAGGANMLLSASLSKVFDIGNRNINAAYQVFGQLNLKLAGHEVGGNIGRTVRLFVLTGKMTVRMVGGQEHEI